MALDHWRLRAQRRQELWKLLGFSLVLLSVCLDTYCVVAESSPPVADVEDLFKDEGFLRMSRGGEAFGRRPPPPPLILGPPHFSTQAPRTILPSSSSGSNKPKIIIPPRSSGNNNGETPSATPPQSPPPKPSSSLDMGEGGGGGGSGSSSDAHPLLGITPAAPGEAFDFNPILSNPAVTRILAGSSGRIPQWEPTLPDLHDLIPEVNYSTTPDHHHPHPQRPVYNNNHHPTTKISPTSPSPPLNVMGSPTRPLFIPSPVSSKISPTMYNMDQLTNNIAIPKHVLPNPSNLATSRTTESVIEDPSFEDSRDVHEAGNPHHHQHHHLHRDRDRDHSNLDESRGVFGGGSDTVYEDEGGNSGEAMEGESKASMDLNNNNNKAVSSSDGNGPKYIVCDALCGAWKHQCKLMGILFSITSGVCLILAFLLLHSLHFSLRDFGPFSLILFFLFITSVSRTSILLGGWFCSPGERPTWLPTLSILPSTFFIVVFSVTLHLARFPLINHTRIPGYAILILSLGSIGLPVSLALGSHLFPESQTSLAQGAWISSHLILLFISIIYLFKFKPFYSKLVAERGPSRTQNPLPVINGLETGNGTTNGTCLKSNSNPSTTTNTKRTSSVKWGCLQARAMFGAALLALTLSIMIIISVSMGRGECEKYSTWTGWVLSLCARMLEFAIVILLLVVTLFSVDVRIISRLTRVSIHKTNVGLINGDIYPTMVSSNTAVQRCIPMYSSGNNGSSGRADIMMLGPTTEPRSSLRGKTFGERALPGERVGLDNRSSMGRGLPLRLGNPPSHSLPGTPVDGFPQGLKLPEPAPASLLVTKVVFGKPVSREVSHHGENPLLCTGGAKDNDASNNIYASLESVKIPSSHPHCGGSTANHLPDHHSSTGSNHSGSDRVLLSAPRDYIYSMSRDLTKTIDSIYDANHRSRDPMYPPQFLEQMGSIPTLSGSQTTRFTNFPTHNHHPQRTDLARTIERIRYAQQQQQPPPPVPPPVPNTRNFVLQLANAGPNHIVGNPPPYCSSESSHDVTPDSGIVTDIHSSHKLGQDNSVYSRDYSKPSSDDVRRLPLLPLQKRSTPGATPIYTPTSPVAPSSSASTPSSSMHQQPLYQQGNVNVVGRVEHLLNQTEHILSRTESLDSNSHSAGLQRLLSHKEQLATVERLLAQAEYAIWLEKRTAQVSQLASDYGYTHHQVPPPFPSANSNNSSGSKEAHSNNNINGNASSKKVPKSLEEESVV